MDNMKVYLVTREKPTWCEDYAMVVIAEDKLHAERQARWNSSNFKKELRGNMTIKEIKLDKEQVVLKSNMGA